MSRFTVANILVLIGVLAAGLAAMRDGSDLTVRIVFTLTLVALVVGMLGAIVRRGDGAWAGFAVCGWCYAIVAFVPAVNQEVAPHLLATRLFDEFIARLRPPPVMPPSPPPTLSIRSFGMTDKAVSQVADFLRMNPAYRSELTPGEQVAWDDYLVQFRAFETRSALIETWEVNSQRIGQSMLSITLALFGAMLGRALAGQRDQDVATSSVSRAVETASP